MCVNDSLRQECCVALVNFLKREVCRGQSILNQPFKMRELFNLQPRSAYEFKSAPMGVLDVGTPEHVV